MCRRLSLVTRRRSNVKSKTMQQRLPAIRGWHRGVKRLVRDDDNRRPAGRQLDPVQGRFPFADRFNVDEVPLAFIPHQDRTMELRGAKSVHIRQPGSGAFAKRFGTLVVGVAGDGTMIPPALIFRGTGQRITQAERAAWNPSVHVLFQPKAWMDRATWHKYLDTTALPFFEARGFKPQQQEKEGLIFLDNLDAHCVNDSKTKLKSRGILSWFHSPGDTDVEQVVDGGLGALFKNGYTKAQDEWLDDEENLERWENNEISRRDRRILVTEWVAKAWNKIRSKPASIIKIWARTGCLMSCDDTNDNKIKVAGVDDYDFTACGDDDADDNGPDPNADPDADAAPPEAEDDNDIVEAFLDNSENDVDELDTDDELDPLESCVPSAFRVVPGPVDRVDESIVGRHLMYKWSVGWCFARATKFYDPPRRSGPVEGLNVELKYPDEAGDRVDHKLQPATYSASSDAPIGSWCLLQRDAGGGGARGEGYIASQVSPRSARAPPATGVPDHLQAACARLGLPLYPRGVIRHDGSCFFQARLLLNHLQANGEPDPAWVHVRGPAALARRRACVELAAGRGHAGSIFSSAVSLGAMAGVTVDGWESLLESMRRPGTFAEAPFVQLDAESMGTLEIHVLSDDLQSVATVAWLPSRFPGPTQQVVLWRQQYEPVRSRE